MRRGVYRVLFGLACLSAVGAPLRAQDLISVDVNVAIADLSRKPIGINVNFLLDNDGNRPRALRTLADALRLAGVKYLRYPGGEKSDGYLWSIPPFASSVPTLARWAEGEWPQNQEWPSYDRALVEADGHTFKTNPLSFDEFMDVCRAIDCVPTIVVCYDSMYKPAQTGGVAPTRAQLIDTAREWVRYANVTKGYAVRYWEIGNESFLNHYNGGATAADYAQDLVAFSQAMKGVDPTIKIGANGQADAWWRAVLPVAGPFIDFLAVHNYPAYGLQSYAAYAGTAFSLTSDIDTARNAIGAYAPAADRGRLTIAVTETGAGSWSGVWPDANDLGHAVLFAEILGEQLRDPLIEFSQLWTTRWSGNDTAATPVLWDALDKDNQLQATAQVLALWSTAASGRMVGSTSTGMVRSYATVSSNGVTRLLLINRDTAARPVAVSGAPAPSTVHTWVFGGSGPADLYPATNDLGTADAAASVTAVTVAPVSITMIEFTPTGAVGGHTLPGLIQAEDFDEDGFFDTTPANKGGRYRATAVDIESTEDVGGGFDVGWIAPGEWLEYTVNVPRTSTYRLAFRAASPFDGESLSVSVDGLVTQSSLPIPNTGGWQQWTSVETNASFSAGRHVLRVATATGAFNLNWIDLRETSSTSTTGHAVPGKIEAEDFDAGRFHDTTAGNTGGEYRATDVDIERTTDAGGGFDVGWMAPGEWLDYTIAASQGAAFDISLRVASPKSDATIGISVDGGVVVDAIAIPNTGGWQNWITVTRTILLSTGPHVLRLSTATGGLNVNWFALQPAAADSGPIGGSVEAEDFNDGGFWDSTAANIGGEYRDTPVDIERTTDAGGGFNVGWIDAGEWLDYAIDVEASASYTFALRVASKRNGSVVELSVDGVPVSGELTVPNTAAWQSWQTMTTPPIMVSAGRHTLRVSTRTGGFNLNWIRWN